MTDQDATAGYAIEQEDVARFVGVDLPGDDIGSGAREDDVATVRARRLVSRHHASGYRAADPPRRAATDGSHAAGACIGDEHVAPRIGVAEAGDEVAGAASR